MNLSLSSEDEDNDNHENQIDVSDDVVLQNQTETCLREGQVFESYDAFKDVLCKFEKETFTKFSAVRSDKINVKPGYCYVELGCKHYGLKRRNKKLTGERPRQKTYKLNCPAVIKLRRTRDKCKLHIVYLNLDHNHVTNKITAAGYPENRRVSKEAKTQAEELLKLRVKPTLIRPFLKNQEDPNKLILGRDISNIGTSRKRTERKGRSDEEMLLDKLNEIRQQDRGADLHIETDPVTNEVVFIFIQTTDMRENLQKFPEVMLMDITYKINKSRMPVSVIEVMDGEGEGLPVGYAFLANETKDTLTAMIKHFVLVSGENAFESTECCVVDKAFEEIGALKETLPGVKIHICSVHTEKNFKKLAKGHQNKKECISLMKALIYCEKQEEFDEVYKNLQLTADTAMMESFDKNWLKCKEAWSLKDKIVVMTLKNHSTNRVERHNRTLKMVFSVDTELFEAVSGLVGIIISNKKDDKLYKMHEALSKITYVNKCSDPVVQVICNDLTDFACKIVCEQLQLSKKSSPFPGKYQQTEMSCTCLLFKTLKLPCRHIMRHRKQSGLPIYSKEHVLQRWWKKYTLVDGSGNPSLGAAPSLPNGELENLFIQPKLPGEALLDVLEPVEKYKKFMPLVSKLKTAVCSVGTRSFYLRYQILLDLIEAWHSGTEVAIVHLSSGQIDDSNMRTVECSFAPEGGAPPFNAQGVSQSAPFVLNKVVVKGKPSGRNETIHDGTKKKGPPKKKRAGRIVAENCCCVCGNEAGSHKCVKCGAVVHAIPPCSVPAPGAEEKYGMLCLCKNCQGNTSRDDSDDDLHFSFDLGTADNYSIGQGIASEAVETDPDKLIECAESQSEEELPNFKLGVVRTKGRLRGKGNGPPKWNYTSLADSMPTCCICGQQVHNDQVCSLCNNLVHGSDPCSNRHGDGGRVCNFCEDPSGLGTASPNPHSK